MLYVSGYEAEKDNSREIVIGSNIAQQIIFEKNFKKIRFLYPFADPTKYLSLSIKVIDKAYYDINIFVRNTIVSSYTITKTKLIYLSDNVLTSHCERDMLCPITIQVEFSKEIIKADPMIEVAIREVKNMPSYLQKNKFKTDFLNSDYFYYLYTDIGKNDICEITVNFLRETGIIWAKVVRKYQIYSDAEANWRNIYRMPSEDWEDSKPFNQFTQKMMINAEDTQDCIEGCYLLISIQISYIGDYIDDFKYYPFSILTRIFSDNKAYIDVPKIIIQVDENIIGNINISKIERIDEFYEIRLSYDSDIVEFDWQSLAGLYINVGSTLPTTKNADFIFPPSGKNSIIKISKEDILNKALSKRIIVPSPNSIQGVNLVIGI